jgi:hypothetical protein
VTNTRLCWDVEVPSYRVRIPVGRLHRGVTPESVLPAAATAVDRLATVEAKDVALVRGVALVSVRFTAQDDRDATRVAQRAAEAVASLAAAGTAGLECRAGNRWRTVRRLC